MYRKLEVITLVDFGAYMNRDVRGSFVVMTEEWHCSRRACA